MNTLLPLVNIYASLLEDGRESGLPVVTVVLGQCRIACGIDGAPRVVGEGTDVSVTQIIDSCMQYRLRAVNICGGEPLMLDGCQELIQGLQQQERIVYLESNLTVDISTLHQDVRLVVDLKCPSAGSCYQFNWAAIRQLRRHDAVKFVIADRGDYVWARDVVKREHLAGFTWVQFTPMPGEVSLKTLADWIIADRLQVYVRPAMDLITTSDDVYRPLL